MLLEFIKKVASDILGNACGMKIGGIGW